MSGRAGDGEMQRLMGNAMRVVALAAITAIGFAIVYIPLMNLFFDKRIGYVYFPIVAASIFAAYWLAKQADAHLPRSSVQDERE